MHMLFVKPRYCLFFPQRTNAHAICQAQEFLGLRGVASVTRVRSAVSSSASSLVLIILQPFPQPLWPSAGNYLLATTNKRGSGTHPIMKEARISKSWYSLLFNYPIRSLVSPWSWDGGKESREGKGPGKVRWGWALGLEPKPCSGTPQLVTSDLPLNLSELLFLQLQNKVNTTSLKGLLRGSKPGT